MKAKILVCLLCAAMAASLAACEKTNDANGADLVSEAFGKITADSVSDTNAENMFTSRDLEVGYSNCVEVTLSDGAVYTDGEGVSIDGDTVTVTKEGTYLFTGTLSDGQLAVDAAGAKIQLVLDGVDVTNQEGAAIYVKQADKVFLTTAKDSVNKLTVSGQYVQSDDNNVDAVIFSKADLTLNGSGTLNIDARYGSGAVSKDDLVVASGAYGISAVGHGLCGKDSVRVAGGSLSIESEKDGIHSENTDDTSLGFAYIAGGNIKIVSADDGVSAGGSLTVNGGDLQITAADDGLHSDSALAIADGSIEILSCAEGVEGKSISISGGYISLVADDDGLNAASGNSQDGLDGRAAMADDPDCGISISGGYISIIASGDGIDSNGSLAVSGGEAYISCSAGAADGALDYNGEAIITGGVVVAAGGSEMAQNFGGGSKQGAILVNLAAKQTEEIILCDENGAVLVSFTPEKAYSCVLVSVPGIEAAKTYTLTAGSESKTIEMTELIYGSGGMGGMRHPAGGKDAMTPPEGGMPANGEIPEGMTPPEGGKAFAA